MGTVVLDSSVLLGLLDPTDVHHASAVALAHRVRERSARVLVPATVLAEVLMSASRLGPEQVDRTGRFVDAIADEITGVDRQLARAAAALCARYPAIRLPDALVIATGQSRCVDEIHTADKRWQAVDRRIHILD